jgi:simple sugar transport system ATP-binding protein
VLVAAHPTRGLDVGSIEYVHGRLVDLAERGRAVVLITSDIDEAMALADRVAVLYRGRVAGVVGRPLSRDELGVLMGGG